jgi:hypothetical protein
MPFPPDTPISDVPFSFPGTADRLPSCDRSAFETPALRRTFRLPRNAGFPFSHPPLGKIRSLNPSNAFHRIDLRQRFTLPKGCSSNPKIVTTLARRFASLSCSHVSLQQREMLPSASPRVSLSSFNEGQTVISTRTTDFCLPKPQTALPASRAFPVPRQGLHPGGENMFWDMFPCR